jgi:3-oxochol-4-en-24-oyl-CoA dehydrogenase
MHASTTEPNRRAPGQPRWHASRRQRAPERVAVAADRVLPGLDHHTVRDVVSTLAAAEMAGVAYWCLDTAAEYAKIREQFGRPIGQFQSIKHLCAEMLVRTEQARATAWDAAYALEDADQRPLATAVARAVAYSAAVDNAKDAVQILRGIGYTWEHDVHLYLRRAMATRALFGPVEEAHVDAARRALAGQRRDMGLALPEEEAAPIRSQIRAFAAELAALDEDERRHRLADEGYLAPHWPRPWGRDASPIQQVVIAEEFAAAGIDVPGLVIGKWILPTIISHGTGEQLERFVPPTFRGELTWCQMFSEPGASSDLASLSTKAARTDGGWLLTGQKVWTSLAHESDYGMCLARTDSGARKHEGITAFIVDMSSPGLDIRPLREMNGRALFNEVFLNDVYVPDENVIGELGGGWRCEDDAGERARRDELRLDDGPWRGGCVAGAVRASRGRGPPDACAGRGARLRGTESGAARAPHHAHPALGHAAGRRVERAKARGHGARPGHQRAGPRAARPRGRRAGGGRPGRWPMPSSGPGR